MRFLCLHGRGTNADIFKAQTARIREAIGQDNEFIFINGHIHADVVLSISSPMISKYGERLSFVPPNAEASVCRAFFLELRHFIETRGPFDGLMGFSEGASIVATVMAEDQRRPFARLKCAILFCTLATVDPILFYSKKSEIRFLDAAVDGVSVRVPTAHIWSNNDNVAQGAPQKVAELFDESTREDMIHNLGHDIPGSRSDEGVQEAIQIIERIIERGKD